MRVEIREIIDIDSPVDARDLTNWERISVAFRKWFRGTDIHKNREERRISKIRKEENQKIEDIRVVMLYYIKNALLLNKYVKSKNEKAESIVISLPSDCENIKDRLIRSQSLLSYNIKEVIPDPDTKLCFPNMPILLEINKKVL